MKYIKFYRYLLPFWKRELFILFLSGIGIVSSLINPYLAKLIIDKAYINRDLPLFIILIIIGGIITVLHSIINGLNTYLNHYIKLRSNFDLNRDVFNKLRDLPYDFFQSSSTGQNLFKINHDIAQAMSFIADSLPQAVYLIPKALFIFVIILYLDWKMALMALAFIPVLYLVPYYFNERMRKSLKIWIENTEYVFDKTQEILSHMLLIKVFGKERHVIRRHINDLIKNIRFDCKDTKLRTAGSFANSLTNRILFGLIIFFGGYQVLINNMTLGTLSAIAIYLAQLSGLHDLSVDFIRQITMGAISCERLGAILDARYDLNNDKQSKDIIFSKGEIRFTDITFGYKKEAKILDNLKFDIAGGSCVGITGPSGCGKTTLLSLIVRLYRPLYGEILIDGHNVNDVKSNSFYGQIGFVPQESYLWNDTLEHNIKFGKEDAAFYEVKNAAQIARIDNFIDSLPGGYNTIIGENACKISEGQKQRIAIARAVIKRPKILILDEAMSSLDSETEDKIIDNIKRGLADSTVIIVSHRLSAIEKMDRVYFLEGPSSVTIGTHAELIERSRGYRDLFASQV
ncbi:MAG: hypothetical protein A2987_04060 [Omnitrophica bacterium RIFCSPLOWO2_01_FULL_45_10]|nr:MAG: hypothetical protein A2987_04060 [Omnitrophica bacterium RIFCSPLOWO2_01_FULL_45_10]